MGLNPNALLIPGRGTVFVGDVDATPPTIDQLASLSPDSPPAGSGNWACLGHMSRENLPKYGKDGGDISAMGSWWQSSIDSIVDPTSYNLALASIQGDALTYGLAFGGGEHDEDAGTFGVGEVSAVAKSLLVLMVGASRRRGFYHPNTSITTGDLPELATDAYIEFNLLAGLNSSGSTDKAWSGQWIQIIDPVLKTTTP